MKVEIVTIIDGDRHLEVIAENAKEYHILRKAWKLMGYETGYGKTTTPDGMAIGFFVPIGRNARIKNKSTS